MSDVIDIHRGDRDIVGVLPIPMHNVYVRMWTDRDSPGEPVALVGIAVQRDGGARPIVLEHGIVHVLDETDEVADHVPDCWLRRLA